MRRPFVVGLAAAAVLVAAASAGLASEGTSSPPEIVLLRLPEGGVSAWSPDSRQIAVAREKELLLHEIDGSVRRVFRRPGIKLGWQCTECAPDWTDDGARLQFLSHREDRVEDAVIRSIGVDGRDEKHRSLGLPVAAATWAPAGWPLIYIPASRYVWVPPKLRRVGPDPDLWRLDSLHGKPRRLFKSRADLFGLRFSPDGSKIIFQREGRSSRSLWEISVEGGRRRRLAGHLVGPSEAEWAPDGRWIALVSSSYRRGYHLFLLPAGGGLLRKIVAEQVFPNPPAWSPDGLWITFSTYEGEIRKVHPDGTELQTIATFPGKYVDGLTWSPDGTHLAYSASPVPTGD